MSRGRPPTAGTDSRTAANSAPSAPSGGERAAPSQTAELRARLAERTADLQRVKAEYDNYRKRVRRDRLAVREVAVANVLRGLLPVLDTIAQVRESGDMSEGCVAVADAMETRLAELGLRSFGEPGEQFDPGRHEALYQFRCDEVSRALCAVVLRPGYLLGDQLLSPAQVVVAAPAGSPSPAAAQGLR
ncbi:nucleotide exchange factor GrpE [Streptomyces sp. 8N706]|uniref:nucleotide exchange factor GrpE n=1 Tax=Streptomyces sp. 8N706 TaxID=3457416 RepID=UPI003FD3581A